MVATLSLVACAFSASAQTLAFEELNEGANFYQIGPTTLVGTVPVASFNAFVNPPSGFDQLSVTYPGPSAPFTDSQSDGLLFAFSTGTVAQIASEFPAGVTYTLTATDSTSGQTASAQVLDPLSLDDFAAPQLTPNSYGLLAGTIAAGSGPTVITFNAFTPSPDATDSFIYFILQNNNTGALVFDTLPATATSDTAPAGFFVAGDSYYANIVFEENYAVGNSLAYVEQNVVEVPEPATWTIISAGLAAVGGVLRGRRHLRTA
jgi:hypothetical protein